MKALIRGRARELGFDECRFTTAQPPESAHEFQEWLRRERHGEMAYLAGNPEKRADPQRVLPGARTVIALAVSYGAAPEADVASANQGVVARYARHQDYHDVLASQLKELSEFVNQAGGPGTRSLWYVDTGPVLERDLAQRAGVGFVGKHTNVIGRRLGNWLLLAEVLTTCELEPDAPEVNRCGSCTRCLDSCPTGALLAPFQMDARRCISYLTIELKGSIPLELRPAIGNRIFGCDDCLAACPWNRFAQEGKLMKAHARPDLGTPDLLQLLQISDEEFRRRFRGTPLVRAKRRGLLRNVCVALGNKGGAEALGPLENATRDPDPLIAEHAAWGLKQVLERQNRRG